MTTVISSSLVISGSVSGADINSNNPIIGYQNHVTQANVSATSEADASHPASHLANVSTFLRWEAAVVTEQFLTVVLDTPDDIDYLAVARHNFGSNINVVSVEGLNDDDWFELVGETLLPDDSAVIFRFTPQPLLAIRLRIQAGAVPAFAAVMYVGKLLILVRRIYVGHTPVIYGRSQSLANHMSISGEFLGRIVLSEKIGTDVELKNLTPGWYRTYFEPFALAAREIPFFFGWRPGTYPYESGFVWLTGDPKPSNQLPNGMMQVSITMAGIST